MLIDYIHRQSIWSRRTFGNGKRTVGLCKHIAKELAEIQASPDDLMEWIDVIILGLDGAWRAGHTPEEIVKALTAKQNINFGRDWPEPGPGDEPTEHVRADDKTCDNCERQNNCPGHIDHECYTSGDRIHWVLYRGDQ